MQFICSNTANDSISSIKKCQVLMQKTAQGELLSEEDIITVKRESTPVNIESKLRYLNDKDEELLEKVQCLRRLEICGISRNNSKMWISETKVMKIVDGKFVLFRCERMHSMTKDTVIIGMKQTTATYEFNTSRTYNYTTFRDLFATQEHVVYEKQNDRHSIETEHISLNVDEWLQHTIVSPTELTKAYSNFTNVILILWLHAYIFLFIFWSLLLLLLLAVMSSRCRRSSSPADINIQLPTTHTFVPTHTPTISRASGLEEEEETSFTVARSSRSPQQTTI